MSCRAAPKVVPGGWVLIVLNVTLVTTLTWYNLQHWGWGQGGSTIMTWSCTVPPKFSTLACVPVLSSTGPGALHLPRTVSQDHQISIRQTAGVGRRPATPYTRPITLPVSRLRSNRQRRPCMAQPVNARPTRCDTKSPRRGHHRAVMTVRSRGLLFRLYLKAFCFHQAQLHSACNPAPFWWDTPVQPPSPAATCLGSLSSERT
jgi:hypothetical protein